MVVALICCAHEFGVSMIDDGQYCNWKIFRLHHFGSHELGQAESALCRLVYFVLQKHLPGLPAEAQQHNCCDEDDVAIVVGADETRPTARIYIICQSNLFYDAFTRSHFFAMCMHSAAYFTTCLNVSVCLLSVRVDLIYREALSWVEFAEVQVHRHHRRRRRRRHNNAQSNGIINCCVSACTMSTRTTQKSGSCSAICLPMTNVDTSTQKHRHRHHSKVDIGGQARAQGVD